MLILSANNQKNLADMNKVLQFVDDTLNGFSALRTDMSVRMAHSFGNRNS